MPLRHSSLSVEVSHCARLPHWRHPGKRRAPCAQAAPLFPTLMWRALALVQECPCAGPKGCPGCCFHLHCRNYNAVLDKAGARVVLAHCLGLEG